MASSLLLSALSIQLRNVSSGLLCTRIRRAIPRQPTRRAFNGHVTSCIVRVNDIASCG